MPDNPEFQKKLSTLKPDIEKLVRKLQLPDSVISGFILFQNTDGPPLGLVRFGNNANQGGNLIKLHVMLSTCAVEIEAKNPAFEGISFADIGEGEGLPSGNAPEDVAYKLAKAVLTSGMEPEHAEEALSLAQQYLMLQKGDK